MSMSAVGRTTFASLANKNYRRYASGQAVSQIGTWMQSVAQAWLVLQLTGSATQLGLILALQTLPVLLVGPYGGVVADRFDKRKLMIALQIMMAMLALVLGLLTISHNVTMNEIYVLAVLLGLNNCFENPARQAFVLELVGPQDLRNAVSLNSVANSGSRAIGPAVAGLVIVAGGIGFCFLLNALSFVAVVVSLIRLDVSELQPSKPTGRKKGQLREGLRYVRAAPMLATPLAMMALVGCLAYEFQVTLPVLAKETFNGDARTYSFMTAAMGTGAIFGGLFIAARGRTGLRAMSAVCGMFGVVIAATAAAPTLALVVVCLFFVGAASTALVATGNTTLQLWSTPEMRGRVMALWTVAFLGSTPIGGPIAGAVAESFGPRTGVAMGAVACFVACAFGLWVHRRLETADGAHVPATSPGAKDDQSISAVTTAAVATG
jgi:MFS family permease